MNIIPKKTVYSFEVSKHSMAACVIHADKKTKLQFYFNDKLVEECIENEENLLDDAKCIKEIVERYLESNIGKYADLIKNHADKILIKGKTIEFSVDIGIIVDVNIHVNKDTYEIGISGNNGQDVFQGKIKANDFSEALEKTRIFIGVLEGVSADLTQKINELSNDIIFDMFRWTTNDSENA